MKEIIKLPLVMMYYLINNVSIFSMNLCNGSKIPQDPKCFIKL